MSEVTSDGKQEMYPQLKRSLENLIEEFRHLSLKYGPIYHELLRAWDEERTTVESWKAFVDAEVPDEADEWEEWNGPKDGSFYGRFYGDEGGMDEFAVLAESAFLTLCEFDTDFQIGRQYRKHSDGLYGWMGLLHDMGFKYPTSLLCSENSVWSLEEFPDLDDLENYVCEWVESEDKTPYPKYPLCWRLVHNVFISSIAALRIIIEPELTLLVGNSLDDLPLPVRLPRASNQDNVGEATPQGSTERHEGPFSMEKKPGGFVLTFRLGDINEEGLFPDWYGFEYMYALFWQPGKAIPVGNMELVAGLACHPSTVIPIGEMEIHAGQPLGVTYTTGEKLASSQGIKDARKELAEIEAFMKESPGQKAYDDAEARSVVLRKYIQEVARYPDHPDSEKQNIPRVVDTTFKNMTDRVRKAINWAKNELRKKKMPNCADYLAKTMVPENQSWIYDPKRFSVSMDRPQSVE